ncbi:MAG: class I SAM-dependent methyltransferase [Alphaproteobacteria bacterium]
MIGAAARARRSVRLFRLGLSTLLGRPRGYFLPYRYAAAAPRSPRAYPAVEDALRAHEPAFLRVLAAIEEHGRALETIGRGASSPPEPRWDQGWFPRLDAAAAYVLVRGLAPRRIIEVGGGHSTRFLARAIRDGGLASELITVDPHPRATLDGVAARHVAAMVETVDPALFRSLGPGDIAFVDSSHILVPGSDVDFILNIVLPSLPAGVYVHFHDVFLPDDYPAEWVWRGYNEQTALPGLIVGGAYEPVFASRYVTTRMKGQLGGSVLDRLARVEGAHESSLWLKKRAPASNGIAAAAGVAP